MNAAGGNVPEATLRDGANVFDLPQGAISQVFVLSFLGTLLPSQVFGTAMIGRKDDEEDDRGCIVDKSSMVTPASTVPCRAETV